MSQHMVNDIAMKPVYVAASACLPMDSVPQARHAPSACVDRCRGPCPCTSTLCILRWPHRVVQRGKGVLTPVALYSKPATIGTRVSTTYRRCTSRHLRLPPTYPAAAWHLRRCARPEHRMTSRTTSTQSGVQRQVSQCDSTATRSKASTFLQYQYFPSFQYLLSSQKDIRYVVTAARTRVTSRAACLLCPDGHALLPLTPACVRAWLQNLTSREGSYLCLYLRAVREQISTGPAVQAALRVADEQWAAWCEVRSAACMQVHVGHIASWALGRPAIPARL